jgi:hypothetical protein
MRVTEGQLVARRPAGGVGVSHKTAKLHKGEMLGGDFAS